MRRLAKNRGFSFFNFSHKYLCYFKKNQFSPSHIFGKEDGRVLVINRLEECSNNDLQFSLQPESAELFSRIHPHFKNLKLLILSELQNKLLILMDF